MAPTLYHCLDALGLPVVSIESRQAYQARLAWAGQIVGAVSLGCIVAFRDAAA
jgi:hypothetical protein